MFAVEEELAAQLEHGPYFRGGLLNGHGGFLSKVPALADLSLPQAPVAFGAGLALGRDTSTAGNVEHVDLSGQYFLCEYLAGTVENRDSSENVSAIFVARRDLSKFIPADRIYPPVLRALEEFDERPSHR